MAPPLVLVTEPEFLRAEKLFTTTSVATCISAPVADEDFAAAIRDRGAKHVIVGHWPYPRAIYHALPKGSVVARFGVGYDGINLAEATAAGVLCTNTPGVLHQSVAELAILFMTAAARWFLPVSSAMLGQQWSPRQGLELEGKTLAIIGVGRIGRALARIAARGFQMRVVGCRRTDAARSDDDADFELLTTDFNRAVQDADFVSLHMPASPENAKYMNRARLAALRPQSWLINTARGAVVDEAALFDALSGGSLAGAALDVFEREPYVPVDPGRDLRTLPNVILMPHVGTNTAEANWRMGARALANIAHVEAGNIAAMDLLNPEVLPGPRL
jgi:phosphoglycerate dehydrogenase-like enzyme